MSGASRVRMTPQVPLLVFCAGLALLVGASCQERQDVYLEAAGGGGEFVQQGDGGGEGGEASLPEGVPMCPLTTCSRPWATCPSSEFPCSTNLSTDDDNCGACGSRCGGLSATTHSRWSCVDGACAFSCELYWGDCDGDPTNGCETYLDLDENNCGGCGIKCPPEAATCYGLACSDFCFGQPHQCDGRCTNLYTDDSNCGQCGIVCDPLGPDKPPLPADMYYGCDDRKCGAPKCKEPGRANCNGILSDGCEVQVGTNDNCSKCGEKCPQHEDCTYNAEFRVYRCGRCDDGETDCGSCTNINYDPHSCGGCGLRCPGVDAPHFEATCDRGSCSGSCKNGYVDCDQNMANGCETNTQVDNRNCGACGNSCLPNQVCFQGRCQVTPCDAGIPGEVAK